MPTPAHFVVPLLVARLAKAGDQWLCDMWRITAMPRPVKPCTTRSSAARYAVFHRGSVTTPPVITGWSGCRLAHDSEIRTELNPQSAMLRKALAGGVCQPGHPVWAIASA